MNVELRNIHKSFGSVHANAGINLSIPAGTIQGILGENGAGKSTLMKILSGFIHLDSGEILLDGKAVSIQTPADAIGHGIGMLHQDPLDFPPLRVLDNFILGHSGSLFPNRKAALVDFQRLSGEFGFKIDPEAYVDSLTVGERQQLEILRLLWLGARVLIFDEPTTGISASQKQMLFKALKLLAGQGKTVLFVSHKLEDVEGLCHRVAVLRQGKLTGQAQPPYNTQSLVAMMFGKAVGAGGPDPCSIPQPVLTLKDLSVEDYRLKVQGVSLEVCAGEVIGLAGMEGSGQGLFLRAVAGLIRPTGGKVILHGKDLTGHSYHTAKHNGAAFLPAARLEEGLVTGMSLTEHFVLSEPQKGFFVDWDDSRQLTQQRIRDFNIRGAPASRVEALSGGNQQRALLAMMRDPLNLLLLEHPTRGLDIESTIYIWSKLKERCRRGTAVIFMSSDLEEILQYSDRVLVFFSGYVSQPLEASGLTSETLGEMIGGKGWLNPQTGKPQ